MLPSIATRGKQSGQILLIAVLLMLAILLTGILFVSIVSFNQTQGQRDVDVSAALALARFGINFVDHQLQYSDEGADWRPPFRPYDAATYNPADPATWPIPPVALRNMATGTITYTAGFYGPDNIPFTDDDYYTEQEILRGYYGIVRINNPGGIPDYYERFGFTRYPDPLNAGGNSTAAELFAHNLALGRGHVLIRVTYDPDPPYEYNDPQWGMLDPSPDPMSKYIKIEAVGVVEDTAPVFRKLTAYKPLPLLDYALWVTDKTNTGRGTKLGFDPWLDMAQDGISWPAALPAAQPDFLTLSILGSIRVNGALNLYGANCDHPPAPGTPKNPAGASVQIGLRLEPLPVANPSSWFPEGGGYLADDKLIATDQIYEPRTSYDSSGGTIQEQGTAIVGYYNNSGTIGALLPQTVWPSYDNPATAAVETFTTYGGRILDGVAGTDAAGYDRSATPINAPDIFARDPDTNLDRYRRLTEHSGVVVYNTATNTALNTGQFGAGKGIYIDNFSDLQFVKADGRSDLNLLMEDWLQHISAGHPRAAESSWKATGR